MVVSRRVARFNRAVVNRFVRPIAGRVPGLGLVHHRGRRSGRAFRTPVIVVAGRGEYVIALIYGAESDWVRNVTAAGGCRIQIRGRNLWLADPRVVRDPTRRPVPWVMRPALRLLRVSDFLHLAVPSRPEHLPGHSGSGHSIA